MKKQLKTTLLLAFCLYCTLGIHAQNADEKLWLELINQARTQPKAFASEHLEALKSKDKEAADMYDKLQNLKVRKPIAFDDGLNKATKEVFKGRIDVEPDKYTKDLKGYGGGMTAGSMSVLEVVIENALSVLNPDYTHIGITIDKDATYGKKFCYYFGTVGDIEREMDRNYQRKYPELTKYKWHEKPLNTAASATYLRNEEKLMVLELNKVRQHPKQYVAYIEDFLVEQSKTWGLSLQESEAAADLIRQLNEMEPAGILTPSRCVYNAAKIHGLDEQRKHYSGHTGSDGSNPWDRIYKACKTELSISNMMDSKGVCGNENLVGGSLAPRDAVIQLLIDQGIPGYGHRQNMLDPQWKYVGCYFVGKINDMPDNWVQNFAR